MAKKKGEKYTAIIDAAVKVIARYGFHQAQVAKIANEANVADGTIYLYFDNKEDILISLFAEKMGQFSADLNRQVIEMKDAKQQLLTLITSHFAHLHQDPDLAVVTQLELRQSNAELRRQINEILKSYLALIDFIVETGKQQGCFQQDMDDHLARYMIFGTLDETVTNWLLKERKFGLLSMAKPVHRLMLRGLAAE